MNKGTIYPFKIQVSDPELAKILMMVSKRRASEIHDPKLAIKAGLTLKNIRKDVSIAPDRRYCRSVIALSPKLDLDYNTKGKKYEFIFKSIF